MATDPVPMGDLSQEKYQPLLEEKTEVKIETPSEQKSDDKDHPVPSGDLKSLQHAYTWDLCMVFNVGSAKENVKVVERHIGAPPTTTTVKQDHHFKRETSRTIAALKGAGLQTLSYYSIQQDEVYVLIGADEARLRREAERIEYDMKLDSDQSIFYGKKIEIPLARATGGPYVSREAWQNLYGKYEWFDRAEGDTDERATLYPKYNEGKFHPGTVFRAIDRLKLTHNILEADERLGGAGLKLRLNDPSNPLIAYFPLEDQAKKQQLIPKWKHWKSLYVQPLEDIREYYGEQIAMYFAFLSFYSHWLVVPAGIGLIFFLWQLGQGHVDIDGIPAFALIIGVWSTLLLENWKRRQAQLVALWGMHNFLNKEQARPEFVGTWEISRIDGRYEESFPFWEKLKRVIFSQTVIWTLIGVVIACVAAIFLFRGFLEKWDSTNGGIIAGVVNAVQIQILNFIYGMVSQKLNDFENHRTDTEYENALIAKSFLFKFVNSYNSLFYIAFIKRHDNSLLKNTCLGKDNCLGELQQQLGTIFISTLVINNAVEIIMPIVKRALARRRENTTKLSWGELLKTKSLGDRAKSPAEVQYEQEPYESVFADWDEIVIQFGYLALFAVAFPIAPFLALIGNYVENKVDAKKLLDFYRRPQPKGAADIGMWFSILNIVSWISVITNIAIITFETRQFQKFDLTTQWLIFVFVEHTVFLVKGAIDYFVPDESLETKTHLQRQEYLANVLIGGMEDRGEFDDSEMSDDVLLGKPPKQMSLD